MHLGLAPIRGLDTVFQPCKDDGGPKKGGIAGAVMCICLMTTLSKLPFLVLLRLEYLCGLLMLCKIHV